MHVADDDEAEETRREMRRTVADLLRAESGPQRRRAAMEGPDGYDRGLYERCFGELGLGGLTVPERLGGLGLGFAEAAVVIAEFGRQVVPSPLPETLVAAALLASGSVAGAAGEVLERMAAEPVVIAVAGLTPLPGDVPVRAAEGRLTGRAGAVPYGAVADHLLVLADRGVHLVAADGPGVVRTGRRGLDHTRRLADVEFDGAPGEPVPPSGDDGAVAARLRDLSRVALAVECAAAAEQCLADTVEYLKLRRQFGRAIGSFQAVKHRCADLAVAVHGARATGAHAVAFAAGAGPGAVDDMGDDLPTVAALAKTVCADTLMRVAAEGLQLHGGVGFTYEHDLHLYFKRGKSAQLLAGTGARLRDELAGRVLAPSGAV